MPPKKTRAKISDNPTGRKWMTLKGVGKIHRKTITKQDYLDATNLHKVARNGRYNSKIISSHPDGKVEHIRRTAMLRRRNKGAKRDKLSSMPVINPGYNPNPANKAHGVPDIFGGPNNQNNLTNDTQGINLGGHKRIENSMGFFIEERRNSGDVSPLKRRGSLILDEQLDNTGKPTKRDYFVHTDAGTNEAGQPVGERHDHYTFKPLS